MRPNMPAVSPAAPPPMTRISCTTPPRAGLGADPPTVRRRGEGVKSRRGRPARPPRGRAPPGRLDRRGGSANVVAMSLPESRLEPPPATLDAARRWLAPVRAALGAEFLAAYVTGSALTEGFDPARSNLNLLVVVRALPPSALDPLAAAIPPPGRGPHVAPLFLGREQLRDSLDVFPIEWLDLLER